MILENSGDVACPLISASVCLGLEDLQTSSLRTYTSPDTKCFVCLLCCCLLCHHIALSLIPGCESCFLTTHDCHYMNTLLGHCFSYISMNYSTYVLSRVQNRADRPTLVNLRVIYIDELQ